MAKVGIHRGITLPHPDKDNYTMWKADITIDGIDASGDVDAQMKEAIAAFEKMAEAIEEPLAQNLSDTSGLSIEGIGFATDLTKHLENDKTWKESVVKEVKKLQKKVTDVTKSDG